MVYLGRMRPIWLIPLRFAGLWVALALVGCVSLAIAGGARNIVSEELASRPWLDMWARWDGRWYELIARDGYWFDPSQQSPVAYFPLYPLSMRAFSALTGQSLLTSGIFISATAGLCAFFLFWKWASHMGTEAIASRAGWVLALWPMAFFLFGAVYSDGLFLCLCLGAFLCLEKEHPVGAALLGALATATRPVAPALVLALLVRSLELQRLRQKPLRVVDFVPALAATGLLAYMAFQYVQFGTATAFIETQAWWGQSPGPRNWFKINFLESERFGERLARSLLHLSLGLLCLGMARRAWKRLGKGYALYIVLIIGMPLASSIDFIGLGRYALACFPALYCWAGVLEERPRLNSVWFPLSVGLLGVCVSKFALGRYIS